MPENNEFRLKFGGYVDQQELKKNVQDAISAINKENSGVGKGVKIPVFNINDIKQQGIKMVEATKDVKKELQNMFSSLGEVKVDSITNMNGQFSQFIATIKNNNQIIDRYVFKLAELQDAEGNAINAFVQMKKTNSDSGLGSVLTKQLGDLEKYKATIDTVLNNHIRVNGEKLLSNEINAKKITDEAVDAIGKIEALKKTAGYNTTEEMKTIKDIVDGLKAEGEEYYRIEKNQKNLIDSQTKEVAAVQNKVTALSNRYIDKTGSNQLFDTKNIEDVNNQIGKIMAKVSELRANTGRSSYDFEANISVLNNMYDALEKNTKGYYKLETEQRKSSELYQKQDKDVQQYLLDVQKIKDTALNSQSGKRLLDEENIKTVRSELAQAEIILRNILNSHKKGDIVDTKSIDDFVIKMKQVNARISNLSDEETVKIASEKSVQSQLNALNRVDQKVKDVRLTYEDGLLKENNIVAFNASLKEVGDELDKLKAKAGSITEEEMRNLTNLTNKFKTTASILAESEKAQSDFEKRRQSQLNTFAQYSESLKKVQETYLTSSSPSYLKDNDYSNDIKNRASEIESMLKNFKDKAGSVTDEQIRKYKELSGELDRLSSRYANIERAETAEEKELLKQKYTLEDYLRSLDKLGKTSFAPEAQLKFKYNFDYQKLYDDYIKLYTIIQDLQTQSKDNKIIPNKDLSFANNEIKNLTQNITLLTQAEKSQESQLDSLSNIENKILSTQSKMLDGSKITTPSYITDISNQITTALNTVSELRAKAGSVTEGEFRDLNNIVVALQREADEYSRIDSAQQKTEGNLQKQKKDLNDLWLQLQGVSRTALNPKAGNRLTDIEHIRTIREEYGQLIELVYKLQKQNESGKIIDIDTMQKATSLFAKLNQDVNVFRQEETLANNLAKAIEKDNQTIWDQKFILDAYYLEIKKIKETTLNPTSASSLLASDDIKKVTDNFERFEQNYNKFRNMNSSGSLINKNDLKETDMILKEIHQDIGIIGTEMRKEMTADTSMQHMKDQAEVYRQSVIGLVQSLQRQGLYVGELRTEIIGIIKELSLVKVPKDITSFNLHLSAIEKKIGNVKDALKAAFETEDLRQKIQIFSSQVQGYMQQNTRAAIMFRSNFKEIQSGINTAKTKEDLVKLQNDFKLLQQNINNAGKAGLTFGERISAAVKKFMMWTGMTNTAMYLIRSIKQMITHTKELDSAMVSLKKVTDETDIVYKQMFANATEKAKELNTSIKNIINSTAEFAKLGFSTDQAQALAEVANVYANVGEMDIQDATESLVSTINGFKDLSADDAWKIIDEFNNVGNKFSISSAGIGEALKRSAASLSESNNSLEESIALVTTANSVIQDPEKVGTALRTMSLRIRGVKSELEKAGLETEGMVESTAKLRELVMAATGVDILEKDQKTFRSTYEILLDISKVWGTMNDELQKSAVLEALAGKLQSNILASILNNGEMLANVYDKASKSENSAMQEQERWSESLEAKAGKIEAIFESISTKVFDSESLKSIFDGLAKILDVIDKLVDSGQGLILLGTTLTGILGGSGNGFFNIKTFSPYLDSVTEKIKEYNIVMKYGTQTHVEFAGEVQNTNAHLAGYITKLNGAKATLPGYISYLIQSSAETVALNIATTALNVAMNAFIGYGIGMLITAISKAINKQKELNQAFKDSTSMFESNTEQIQDYIKQISSISEASDAQTESLERLRDIKDEVSEKYDIEIGKINDVIGAKKELLDILDQEEKSERATYIRENEEAYNKARTALNDNSDGVTWEDFVNKATGKYANIGSFSLARKRVAGKTYDLNISDEVKSLFPNISEQGNLQTFDIGFEGTDEIKYLDILKKKLEELQTLREQKKPKSTWTTDDEDIYQLMLNQYEQLENKNKDYTEQVKKYAVERAKYLMDIWEQGDLSDLQYQTLLFNRANGDQYVIDALKEILNLTEETAFVIEESAENSPFAEILANLSKVAETAKTVREEIKTADEQFEKLTKTIDDNKDVDKFFSASDIIEILELYPSLNDAILETAYGYKIDEEALESLRNAKLEEKKTALQAQLDEAQGVLDATKVKLEAYKQDLKGVQDVAQAKVRLAELEAKLAQLGANTTNPYYNNSSLEQQIALYKDYIDASETYEKQQEEIEKLSIELKVLGSDFNKAKDATDAQTDALNSQKDAIKELNDEYKDAKDAIEDLIKLTMDYIKKTKNLEKDALKEQLDNFKKLIEKRKELIDLEKEQYDFENKLKDQNRDLLKIQQELDALSVEGVEYSLEDMKRKAELEEKLVEEERSRTDFLYDHEVDVRKDALDKEQENFEEQINTQIKAIEDYLDKEGRLRQDAIDLINGKSEEFYNNLLDYTLTYTDKSHYEFQQLWDSAYSAILKFAGGELDADLALMNLIASMKVADEQLKNIESSINNIKHATDAAKQAMYEYSQVTSDTKAKMEEATDEAIELAKTVSAINYQTDPRFQKPVGAINYQTDPRFIVSKFHSGGIVEGVSTEHGEVLAKLLSGEVVVTEGQARTFMEKTLPKLAGTSVTNNSSLAPVINMGDINIAGNADQNVVDQLRSVQKDIVNDVFKTINNQKNIFNGRIR